MSSKTPARFSFRAFTLLELLVVIVVVCILAALAMPAFRRALAQANRVDATARLRSLGHAVVSYANDNNGILPGPLWPGQVLLYDPNREGRIVRDLGTYLDIEQRTNSYLVDRMFPRAYRAAMPPGSPGDARVYIVNPGWVAAGVTNAPFGSLTTAVPIAPMRITQLNDLAETNHWMISEADQLQSYVAAAPWKSSTPARPLHDGSRAMVRFDGSVVFEKVE